MNSENHELATLHPQCTNKHFQGSNPPPYHSTIASEMTWAETNHSASSYMTASRAEHGISDRGAERQSTRNSTNATSIPPAPAAIYQPPMSYAGPQPQVPSATSIKKTHQTPSTIEDDFGLWAVLLIAIDVIAILFPWIYFIVNRGELCREPAAQVTKPLTVVVPVLAAFAMSLPFFWLHRANPRRRNDYGEATVISTFLLMLGVAWIGLTVVGTFCHGRLF